MKDDIQDDGIRAQTLDLERETQSFFLLPVEVLRELNSDMGRMVGRQTMKALFFKAGQTSGRSIVKRMGFPYITPDRLNEVLPELWIEIGIGLISVENDGDRTLLVRSVESSEAKAIGLIGEPSCHLTRGLLAGVCSSMVGMEYDCEELECLSQGDPHCTFRLSPAGDRYISHEHYSS